MKLPKEHNPDQEKQQESSCAHNDEACQNECGGKEAGKFFEDELQKKASEYNELWNKYLRLHADFENSRKRWDREKGEMFRFANYQLILDLIVVLDDLEHALRIGKEHNAGEQMLKGIEISFNRFFGILQKCGLELIVTKGKKFDPHCHEIVGQKEIDEGEEHMVLEEVQKGYFLNEKVLRTAKVIVSVKKNESHDTGHTRESGDNGASTSHE
ncbi:MAG: nucleotide exchange factor GrpE [Candidatus Omnitrophica bacterium]|nr:nucleotide exchange factor GrpE [Candidatus Omnitrophota bacterium]